MQSTRSRAPSGLDLSSILNPHRVKTTWYQVPAPKIDAPFQALAMLGYKAAQAPEEKQAIRGLAGICLFEVAFVFAFILHT